MVQRSSDSTLRRKFAAVALLTPLVLTACTIDKGPTVAQAGQTLKGHILQLLQERHARDVTITDPGGKNVPCGHGRAKQTFAVRATDIDARSKSQLVKDGLVATLKRVAPYEIASDDFDSKPIRLENQDAATVLYVGSPLDGQIDLRGETHCLKVS
ncbi:hypothetical protein ABZT47_11465 [Sphaerisporangium sp. NPDC005289]|uniref:hypothetical protein n=1 Tax=Sphaerisporangium sp. NPDC005289 TaxID=3155247 RepID=UPI0033B40BE8